jgi:hypothetical protein
VSWLKQIEALGILDVGRSRSPAARLGNPRRTASASVNLPVTTTPEADAQIYAGAGLVV